MAIPLYTMVREAERVAGAPRSDALPEHANYADDGCPDGVYPSCLQCPLAQCRFDVGGMNVVRRDERHSLVKRLASEGLSREAIMAAAGVSKRTVYRALEGRRA